MDQDPTYDSDCIILAQPPPRKSDAKDKQKDDPKPQPSATSPAEVVPLPIKVKGPLRSTTLGQVRRIVEGSQNVEIVACIPGDNPNWIQLGNHSKRGNVRLSYVYDELIFRKFFDDEYPGTTQINVSFEGEACKSGNGWSATRWDVHLVLRLLVEVADRCEFRFRIGDPYNLAVQWGFYDSQIAETTKAFQDLVDKLRGDRTTVRIADEYQMMDSHMGVDSLMGVD